MTFVQVFEYIVFKPFVTGGARQEMDCENVKSIVLCNFQKCYFKNTVIIFAARHYFLDHTFGYMNNPNDFRINNHKNI